MLQLEMTKTAGTGAPMTETRAFQKGKMALRNVCSHGVRFQVQEQSQQQEQMEKTMKSTQSLSTHCHFY